ncbi:hypothetical protein DFJ67_0324 [Asanoa ferruginea]|uniref:Uncharacterized protein n=1 Tax=Asanoa ferruginea TaxID=53367 RepID=A0A3D9ZAT8_9ACTN|nr:hypothetical protein DFJ67_0324 [Asanoa ferruginea]
MRHCHTRRPHAPRSAVTPHAARPPKRSHARGRRSAKDLSPRGLPRSADTPGRAPRSAVTRPRHAKRRHFAGRTASEAPSRRTLRVLRSALTPEVAGPRRTCHPAGSLEAPTPRAAPREAPSLRRSHCQRSAVTPHAARPPKRSHARGRRSAKDLSPRGLPRSADTPGRATRSAVTRAAPREAPSLRRSHCQRSAVTPWAAPPRSAVTTQAAAPPRMAVVLAGRAGAPAAALAASGGRRVASVGRARRPTGAGGGSCRYTGRAAVPWVAASRGVRSIWGGTSVNLIFDSTDMPPRIDRRTSRRPARRRSGVAHVGK